MTPNLDDTDLADTLRESGFTPIDESAEPPGERTTIHESPPPYCPECGQWVGAMPHDHPC